MEGQGIGFYDLWIVNNGLFLTSDNIMYMFSQHIIAANRDYTTPKVVYCMQAAHSN